MTNDTLRLEVEGRSAVHGAGLTLGALFGGMHLAWVLLVAAGVAQPLADFIYWLHFIRPVWVIERFDAARAIGLVSLTSAIGYAVGAISMLLWGRLHRADVRAERA